MSVKVTVSSIGSSQTYELEDGATLDVALAEAGINPDRDGLNVRVNGEASPVDVSLEPGDQVSVTPREAKLG